MSTQANEATRGAANAAVDLHFEERGGGLPVIIMHGLFGSLSNWRGVAQSLSANYRVINVDLRNHGRSPHAPGLSYEAMANDILAVMDRLGVERAHLIGHSLGGKLGMVLADRHPERVARLAVVDIAPKWYPPWHKDVFAALDAVDLDALESREQARQQMAAHVFEPEVRAFLAANLEQIDGQWRWRFNLPELKAAYAQTSDMPELSGFYLGPALFIRGAQSAYIEAGDEERIARDFPQSCIVTLERARHWPHIEDTAGFLDAVTRFFAHGCQDFPTRPIA
ncbi:MAG: alpha/beta fold hydrolase [Guyparkeria sp.]|uniref:alpha/beta fold hydrolase n=1 Tax=Guyparkeria sp. TaxID=2035736 RepID=UPI00397A53D1